MISFKKILSQWRPPICKNNSFPIPLLRFAAQFKADLINQVNGCARSWRNQKNCFFFLKKQFFNSSYFVSGTKSHIRPKFFIKRILGLELELFFFPEKYQFCNPFRRRPILPFCGT
jgi:hypothetical protein